jgi:hypothetical protein
VGLETNVAALTAALDLKLVRLLRGAMNTTDAGRAHPLGPAPNPPPQLRRVDPEPVFEPRPHIHPTPYFEPRLVHRPAPSFRTPAPLPPPPREPPPCEPCGKKHLIQPPWAVLAWETPIQPEQPVKVHIVRPDTISKGSLIDFFC